jgi:hypothetical protein
MLCFFVCRAKFFSVCFLVCFGAVYLYSHTMRVVSSGYEQTESRKRQTDSDTKSNNLARQWSEVVLATIRLGTADPTTHSRDLFLSSLAMWNSWCVYNQRQGIALLLLLYAAYDACVAEAFAQPCRKSPVPTG